MVADTITTNEPTSKCFADSRQLVISWRVAVFDEPQRRRTDWEYCPENGLAAAIKETIPAVGDVCDTDDLAVENLYDHDRAQPFFF